MRNKKAEFKVGMFAALLLLIIGYSTLKISEGAFFFTTGYDVLVTLDTAIGINAKTPVEIAGIQVGVVKTVGLADDGRRASVVLRIERDDVRLPEGTEAVVRAKGFLGDTYIELRPGKADAAPIPPGGELAFGGVGGDINMLVTQFNEIAGDIKAVTSSLKDLMGTPGSPVEKSLYDLEKFARIMRELAQENQQNINRISENFAAVSEDLRTILTEGRSDVLDSLDRVSSITRKIDEGQGTVGRLVNDDETVTKLNDALSSLDEALGGFKKLETEIGYHTEFLGASHDFKHYIHFDLWPRPDEAFLFEFVEDRSPSAKRVSRTTTVTSGGTTSTVQSDISTIERNRFLVSAQLAKKLYDVTLRGGIIESRGGIGLDYTKGPLAASFSAFDFNTQNGNKPHLKATGTVRMTPALYVVGGADDMINPNQSTDWFVGAGLSLRDDDIKSILTAGGMGAALKR